MVTKVLADSEFVAEVNPLRDQAPPPTGVAPPPAEPKDLTAWQKQRFQSAYNDLMHMQTIQSGLARECALVQEYHNKCQTIVDGIIARIPGAPNFGEESPPFRAKMDAIEAFVQKIVEEYHTLTEPTQTPSLKNILNDLQANLPDTNEGCERTLARIHRALNAALEQRMPLTEHPTVLSPTDLANTARQIVQLRKTTLELMRDTRTLRLVRQFIREPNPAKPQYDLQVFPFPEAFERCINDLEVQTIKLNDSNVALQQQQSTLQQNSVLLCKSLYEIADLIPGFSAIEAQTRQSMDAIEQSSRRQIESRPPLTRYLHYTVEPLLRALDQSVETIGRRHALWQANTELFAQWKRAQDEPAEAKK